MQYFAVLLGHKSFKRTIVSMKYFCQRFYNNIKLRALLSILMIKK